MEIQVQVLCRAVESVNNDDDAAPKLDAGLLETGYSAQIQIIDCSYAPVTEIL